MNKCKRKFWCGGLAGLVYCLVSASQCLANSCTNWIYSSSQSSAGWSSSVSGTGSDANRVWEGIADGDMVPSVNANGISVAVSITNRSLAEIRTAVPGNTYSVGAYSSSYGSASGVWTWNGAPGATNNTRTITFDVNFQGKVSSIGSAQKDNLSSRSSQADGAAHTDFGTVVITDTSIQDQGPYFWVDADGYARPATAEVDANVYSVGTFTSTNGDPIQDTDQLRVFDPGPDPLYDYEIWSWAAEWAANFDWGYYTTYNFNYTTRSGATTLRLVTEVYLDTYSDAQGGMLAVSLNQGAIEGYANLTFQSCPP